MGYAFARIRGSGREPLLSAPVLDCRTVRQRRLTSFFRLMFRFKTIFGSYLQATNTARKFADPLLNPCLAPQA